MFPPVFLFAGGFGRRLFRLALARPEILQEIGRPDLKFPSAEVREKPAPDLKLNLIL
jgi:hypothetical protein